MPQMHEGPVGGYFGVDRTMSRLQTRYYWYKIRAVSLWYRTCTSCATKARPLKRPQAPIVYRIQRNLRTKVKVDLHDKLKPYHSWQPLGNSWVFKDSGV
ncbi:uncharacterized protein LOC115774026 [Tachysurus ichikawai]